MDSAYAMPSKGGISSKGSGMPKISSLKLVDTDLPKAKDMYHHLNRVARNRLPSKLKELYKYASMPGMIPMGGGIPHPDIFPFEELSALTLPYNHISLDLPRSPEKSKVGLIEWLFGGGKKLDEISIPKYVKNPTPSSIQLSTSLQYQAATGPPALSVFIREYVEKIYRPAYMDWDILPCCGSTDSWGKICQMILEMGDAVLVEEWTYPGATNAFLPLECEMVGVKMDGLGALPEHLEELLGGWDEKQRGKKRPSVFYTVPTGQNPSGATMTGERKKEVYKVCQKYDVIICEDEPYYCLYVGEWQARNKKLSSEQQAQLELEKKEGKEGNEAFIKALPNTFLAYDTDGRVIRMDTFSKTSCPGSRLGWITTSPLFIERLTRETEAQTQAPSGFVTSITTTLLLSWGFDNYIRWLRGIKSTYKQRRDWIIDAFQDIFHIEVSGDFEGDDEKVMMIESLGKGITCYEKEGEISNLDEKKGVMSKGKGKPLVSFIPPTAGMFIFLAVHISSHPLYPKLLDKGQTPREATQYLMEHLWRALAQNLVLFAPGWGFDANGEHNIGGEGVGYFRLSFSTISYEQCRIAVGTFEKVLTKFLKGNWGMDDE